MPDGRLTIEAVGEERFHLSNVQAGPEHELTGTVEPFPLAVADEALARGAAQALSPFLGRYLSLLSQAADTHFTAKPLPDSPAALAYLAAIVAQVPLKEKQALLSIPSAIDLLQAERTLYRREISLLRAMLSTASASQNTTLSPN